MGAASQESPSIFRKSSVPSPRAQRRNPADVPSVSMVKFPWGLEARLLNISRTGLLFESGTRIPPDNCEQLTLVGPGVEIQVPSCFVRSEVALVSGLGVKYHIAVMFSAPLELEENSRPLSLVPAPTTKLSHLLSCVGAELESEPRPSHREAVERAVRQVTGALDVQIHDGVIAPAPSGETFDFAVPTSADAPVIMRVAFAPGLKPTPADLRLTRAAARLAAIVLEFDGHPRHS
jgi:hypothetical protein